MDPIQLIVAALVAGAAAAAKDTAASTVKDAFMALRELVRSRVAGGTRSPARSQVPQMEYRSERDLVDLEARLRAAGADRDEELLAAARALLEQLGLGTPGTGKYDVRIMDSKGVIVGDYTTATITINDGD